VWGTKAGGTFYDNSSSTAIPLQQIRNLASLSGLVFLHLHAANLAQAFLLRLLDIAIGGVSECGLIMLLSRVWHTDELFGSVESYRPSWLSIGLGTVGALAAAVVLPQYAILRHKQRPWTDLGHPFLGSHPDYLESWHRHVGRPSHFKSRAPDWMPFPLSSPVRWFRARSDHAL
jgi:hypothetical protein